MRDRLPSSDVDQVAPHTSKKSTGPAAGKGHSVRRRYGGYSAVQAKKASSSSSTGASSKRGDGAIAGDWDALFGSWTDPSDPSDQPGQPVQLLAGASAASGGAVQQLAAAGVNGASSALPHAAIIQKSFGRHDISPIKSVVGGPAAAACDAIGANAYMTNGCAGFKSAPSLHTSAHEAAHFIHQQGGVQLEGGVGRAGDAYEINADQVADAVVAGKSAEGLLDRFAGKGGSIAPATQLKASGKAASTRIRVGKTYALNQGTETFADHQGQPKGPGPSLQKGALVKVLRAPSTQPTLALATTASFSKFWIRKSVLGSGSSPKKAKPAKAKPKASFEPNGTDPCSGRTPTPDTPDIYIIPGQLGWVPTNNPLQQPDTGSIFEGPMHPNRLAREERKAQSKALAAGRNASTSALQKLLSASMYNAPHPSIAGSLYPHQKPLTPAQHKKLFVGLRIFRSNVAASCSLGIANAKKAYGSAQSDIHKQLIGPASVIKVQAYLYRVDKLLAEAKQNHAFPAGPYGSGASTRLSDYVRAIVLEGGVAASLGNTMRQISLEIEQGQAASKAAFWNKWGPRAVTLLRGVRNGAAIACAAYLLGAAAFSSVGVAVTFKVINGVRVAVPLIGAVVRSTGTVVRSTGGVLGRNTLAGFGAAGTAYKAAITTSAFVWVLDVYLKEKSLAKVLEKLLAGAEATAITLGKGGRHLTRWVKQGGEVMYTYTHWNLLAFKAWSKAAVGIDVSKADKAQLEKIEKRALAEYKKLSAMAAKEGRAAMFALKLMGTAIGGSYAALQAENFNTLLRDVLLSDPEIALLLDRQIEKATGISIQGELTKTVNGNPVLANVWADLPPQTRATIAAAMRKRMLSNVRLAKDLRHKAVVALGSNLAGGLILTTGIAAACNLVRASLKQSKSGLFGATLTVFSLSGILERMISGEAKLKKWIDAQPRISAALKSKIFKTAVKHELDLVWDFIEPSINKALVEMKKQAKKHGKKAAYKAGRYAARKYLEHQLETYLAKKYPRLYAKAKKAIKLHKTVRRANKANNARIVINKHKKAAKSLHKRIKHGVKTRKTR